MHEFDVLKELETGSFGGFLKSAEEKTGIFAMETVKQLRVKEKGNALNEVRLLAFINYLD